MKTNCIKTSLQGTHHIVYRLVNRVVEVKTLGDKQLQFYLIIDRFVLVDNFYERKQNACSTFGWSP